MGLFKVQRFRNSNEVNKHMSDKGRGGHHYRDGKRSGTYYDLPDGDHLHVKDGEIGPAANMFIVSVLSCAGLLAAVFAFMVFGG